MKKECSKRAAALFLYLGSICMSCQTPTTIASVSEQQQQPELRLGARYKINFERLDPTTYGEASEYDYITYLYSPLVEFDEQGKIVSGLAKKYYWKDNDLIFELRDNIKSSRGDSVTAEDASISLKRLQVRRPDQYQHLFADLCEKVDTKDISQHCPGIEAVGQTLTLHFKSPKPAYITLFAAADFAIVPKKAIDLSNLKIIDRSNGTGLYRIIEANESESFFRLKARQDHWHWKKNIPQKVLVKSLLDPNGREASDQALADAFYEEKLDLLPTYVHPRGVAAYSILKNVPIFDVFVSAPFSTYVLFFSNRAKKDFSVAERLAIGEIFRRAFYTSAQDQFEGALPASKTYEVFPANSDGSLNPKQRQEFQKLLTQSRDTKLNRVPSLHVIEAYMQDIVASIRSTGGRLSYKNDETYSFPPNDDFNERFDAFFSLMSMPPVESIETVLWFDKMGWIPYSKGETNEWISKYIESEDTSRRVEMLKKLQFDILAGGMAVALKNQSYEAIARKPWRLKLSHLFPNTPLWQIEFSPESYEQQK